MAFELDLESSQDGVKRLIILPDFRRMIVAGDNNSLGASFTYKAFNLNLEWVVVSPTLKVMSQYCMLFPEVVKQYSILVLVSVPPLITWLVEKAVAVSRPDVSRFTRTCGSIDPSVMKISESRLNGSVKLES